MNKQLCVLLVSFLMVCGCAGPVIRTTHPEIEGQPEELSVAPKPVSLYQIQVGDELAVKFFYNHDLDESLIVRPDGRISLQLIHDVEAQGKTPEHLAWEIMERYKKILNKPEVSVIVKHFSGQKIYVGGEVKQAGQLSLDSPLTALQAIFQAGGVLDTASLHDVMLVRRGEDNKPKLYQLNLEDPANDTFLTGYDILFVTRSNIASMNLFVSQYIDKMIPISRSIGLTYVPSNFVVQ